MGGDKVSFKQVVQGAPPYQLAVEPSPLASETYTALTARYKKLEDSIVSSSSGDSKRRKIEN